MMAAAAVPHPLCPLHDLHAGALGSSHRVCMERHGCPPLFPPGHCTRCCGGEGGITAPHYGCGCGLCIPPGVGLGPPVLLYLLPLTLPRCPSRGGVGIPLRSGSRRPCPPHCHPPGAGGPGSGSCGAVSPPLMSCPLLHQPGGDAVEKMEQPLGGGGGGLPPGFPLANNNLSQSHKTSRSHKSDSKSHMSCTAVVTVPSRLFVAIKTHYACTSPHRSLMSLFLTQFCIVGFWGLVAK